jgi:hypothetical protein
MNSSFHIDTALDELYRGLFDLNKTTLGLGASEITTIESALSRISAGEHTLIRDKIADLLRHLKIQP